MRIEAIAWDIDGTLVDSEPLHQEALNAISHDLGIDMSDLHDDRFRGIHMGDVWRMLESRMPAGVTEESWGTSIVDYYIARAHTLKPLPGVLDLVRRFAAAGIRQACVSNSSRRVVDANLAGLGILPFIDFSISLDDVAKGKPDPEPYATACRRLGALPAHVLGVEDSHTGFASAKAAGLVTAFHTVGGNAPAGADIVFSDMHDLGAFVLAPAASAVPSGAKRVQV
ncbi:HAD family hydrolase [Labrys sp. KB_33_2]|uniref:HAD family hydrolase n=1 Tax=Labrys sp. KB_33_2 TaxID=3237479 RepID=UPI003F8E314D